MIRLSFQTLSLWLAALGCLLSSPAGAVTIDMVTVGNPGNANDTGGSGIGRVNYSYQIGKYDVTIGQSSKKALSEKVFGKDVVVIAKTNDRYGRTVGHVMIDGRDVNLEMLEEGMAWHYKKYDHNARLARAEEDARVAKKGLWQDGAPVPPWEWRASKRMR